MAQAIAQHRLSFDDEPIPQSETELLILFWAQYSLMRDQWISGKPFTAGSLRRVAELAIALAELEEAA